MASRGVTLIELMIVVAVVAILAAIGFPSYRDYRLKAGRGVGESCLVEAEQRFEAFFAKNLRLPDSLEEVGLRAACGDDPAYLLSFTPAAGSQCAMNDSPGHYALRATPQGDQARDGILILCVSPSVANPNLHADRQHARTESPNSLLAGWDFRPGR